MFYQVKMIRKKEKPPIWRRAYVPSNITFTQMALILEELLEFPKSDLFEFEFFQKKDRIIEWHEEDGDLRDYTYDYLNAPDTYVNAWFEGETWFTFRIRNRINRPISGLPEYRVEIEKLLEGVSFDENHESLNYPLLTKEKSSSQEVYWTRGREINDYLKEFYFLIEREAEYLYFSELLEQIGQKRGIGSCKDMVDRDIHNYESFMTQFNALTESVAENISSKLMDTLKDQLKYDEESECFPTLTDEGNELTEEKKAELDFSFRDTAANILREDIEADSEWQSYKELHKKATIEGMLSVYTRKELIETARELGLNLSAKRKDAIAFAIARHILEPEVMRGRLLQISEEGLDALEAAMDRGLFLPTLEEIAQLEPLFDLNYVAAFTDGLYEVPEEVRIMYSVLSKQGYRKFHTEARWLFLCMRTFNAFHAVAPTKVLYQMYGRQKPQGSKFQDFAELFEKIPDKVNPCCIKDGRVMSKQLAQDDLYQLIEQRQRDVIYYIPTKQEILAFADDRYPSSEKTYQDMRQFLWDELHMEKEECSYFCAKAFYSFSSGGSPTYFIEQLKDEKVAFESEQQLKTFLDILVRVNNNTRMFELRGHTPEEMYQMLPHRKAGRMPTAASVASDEARPKGSAGKIVTGKKIYPNDPCPCGSGKNIRSVVGEM